MGVLVSIFTIGINSKSFRALYTPYTKCFQENLALTGLLLSPSSPRIPQENLSN